MQTESTIERGVMRRVYRVRLLRTVSRGYVLGPALALLALYGIGRMVWVARVFENAPADFLSAAQFYLAAFTHTEFMVQLLSVAVFAALVWMMYDALRPYARMRDIRIA
ncbi:MAG: hypothetical protein KBC38_01765 [Candidatus Pacebacteria bacterium]|nr:hypothetical protein [Candidatus Paceibacterota bacterium]MBP9840020.1 hypothetical protein [Candidatus Paceibacterota bacterium]